MFPFNAAINFRAEKPRYIFKNAKTRLPGVMNHFPPRYAQKRFGLSSIKPNDIDFSRIGRNNLMHPSTDDFYPSSYR